MKYIFLVFNLTNFVTCDFLLDKNGFENKNNTDDIDFKILADHTKVTNGHTFPYVVAILKKDGYLSAGALLDDKWVITAADSLYLLGGALRMIRVRLGSINHRKGGIVLPVKFIEVHPKFDDNNPKFDIALLRLSQDVRLTNELYPIRLQTTLEVVTGTHFIVTAWFAKHPPTKSGSIDSLDTIKQRRILSVSHLHPLDPEQCDKELDAVDINSTDTIMCLDQPPGVDPCTRETGAPVLLNSVLWGIVSSWTPEDCNRKTYPTFVTLVGSRDVNLWIKSIMYKKCEAIVQPELEYEDNFLNL